MEDGFDPEPARRPDTISQYKPGTTIEERGFASTTARDAPRKSAVKPEEGQTEYKFIVHGKNGRDISELSAFPSEAEVLFKSGTKFHVKSVDHDKKSIEMEEVGDPDSSTLSESEIEDIDKRSNDDYEKKKGNNK